MNTGGNKRKNVKELISQYEEKEKQNPKYDDTKFRSSSSLRTSAQKKEEPKKELPKKERTIEEEPVKVEIKKKPKEEQKIEPVVGSPKLKDLFEHLLNTYGYVIDKHEKNNYIKWNRSEVHIKFTGKYKIKKAFEENQVKFCSIGYNEKKIKHVVVTTNDNEIVQINENNEINKIPVPENETVKLTYGKYNDNRLFCLTESGNVYYKEKDCWKQIDLGEHKLRTMKRGRYDFIVGITTDNKVLTWGNDDNGRRGKNYVKEDFSIFQFGEVDPIQIECGASHVLVLLENGDIYAWGDNTYHQINEEEIKSLSKPLKLQFSEVESIACGYHHTALYSSNNVTYFGEINTSMIEQSKTQGFCYGTTFGRSLIIYENYSTIKTLETNHGIESISKLSPSIDAPVDVINKSSIDFKIINNFKSILVGDDKKNFAQYNLNEIKIQFDKVPLISKTFKEQILFCSFSSYIMDYRQVLITLASNEILEVSYYGIKVKENNIAPPANEKVKLTYSEYGIGESKIFCLTESGNAYYKGHEDWEKVDLGEHKLVQMKRGQCNFIAGITTENQVITWGYNYCGRRGNDKKDEKYSIISIENESKPIQIESGWSHVVVLYDNGSVYAWGDNRYIQIRDSSDLEFQTPVELEHQNIDSIACGERHTALYKNGFITYFGEVGGVRIKPSVVRGYCHGTCLGRNLIIYAEGKTHITCEGNGLREITYF